jgi:FkbM family methyltransferase
MDYITKKTVLPYLASYLPASPVIVEAGAFNGNDSLAMHAFWPHATIHSFEPVPDIFNLLEKNTAHVPNIHRYPYALSDATGTAPFHVSASPKHPTQPFQAGSLLKPKERLKLSPVVYPTTITVNTITLDEWAKNNRIALVDFLWLDIQGYELNVLKASPVIVATLRALLVEVEFVEAYENQYLYDDVKVWLQTQGFSMVAQDFPQKPTWFFGNALFVRENNYV